MANDETTAQNPITGQVLFYNRPEPLSSEAHGNLGVKKIDQPFGFLRAAHAVPVTVTEFGMTAPSFPIIFVGDTYTPVAVMGVNQGQNLYVDETGNPDPNVYLPAFIRRYPFVFAGDESQEQLLLCIDRDAPMLSDQPEIPFFENGQASKFTTDAIEFCKEFERQRQSTLKFVELLKRFDLLEQKSVSFQPRNAAGEEAGPQQKIADYFAISEEKLNGLTNEQFIELKDQGALGAIYAHLVSLLNWQRVIQRALMQAQEAQATAAGTA